MPTRERRIVRPRVVVLAGVDRGVDVGDQPGDRLDALPRPTRHRVGGLRRLDVAGANGVGERRRLGLHRLDLLGDVGPVALDRLGDQRVVGRLGDAAGGDAVAEPDPEPEPDADPDADRCRAGPRAGAGARARAGAGAGSRFGGSEVTDLSAVVVAARGDDE